MPSDDPDIELYPRTRGTQPPGKDPVQFCVAIGLSLALLTITGAVWRRAAAVANPQPRNWPPVLRGRPRRRRK